MTNSNLAKKLNKDIYHSTQELLINYKAIKAAVQSMELFSEDDRTELLQIMSDMANTTNTGTTLRLVSTGEKKMNERQKTNIILMTQVEKALMVLKKIPNNGHYLFDVLNIIYLEDNNLTNDTERAFTLGLSRPTFLKRKKEALNAFSAIIWGSQDIYDIMTHYSSLNMH